MGQLFAIAVCQSANVLFNSLLRLSLLNLKNNC